MLGAGQVSDRTEVPSQRSGEGGPGGSTSPCVPDQTRGHFSRNCSEQARNSCQVPSAHHKPRSGAGRASVLSFSCPDNAPREAATLPWLQMGKLRHEGRQCGGRARVCIRVCGSATRPQPDPGGQTPGAGGKTLPSPPCQHSPPTRGWRRCPVHGHNAESVIESEASQENKRHILRHTCGI